MLTLLYRPNAEKVAAEIIEDEAIIINVATGTYYNTEGIGGWVWKLCADGKTVAEIVAQGCARFDISEPQLTADLGIFFESLQAEDLVTASETVPTNVEISGGLENRAPYLAPKLIVYRDLKDLLALDPPMPRLDVVPTANNE